MNSQDFFCQTEFVMVGCLLRDQGLIDEVSGIIRPEDFFNHRPRIIFEKILEMRKNGEPLINTFVLADKLKGELGTEGELITEMVDMQSLSFAPENAKHYAKIVKSNSNKRKISMMLSYAQTKIIEEGENVLEYLNTTMTEIQNDNPIDVRPYSDTFGAMLAEIDDQFNRKTPFTGVSTGFKEIDLLTNGLQNGELIVIGGRPSMGKTMLACNIADNIGLIQQLPTIFFSLEMNEKMVMKRTVSRFAKVPGEKIFSTKLDASDFQKISQFSFYIKQSKLFINDQCRLTVNDMRSYARKVKSIHGLSAIFIDYLGLMNSEAAENETIRLGMITADLKAMAKDLNVPVVLLCQLNRGVETRTDKRPTMADIRQSGAIEQDADLIFLLYRDEQYYPASTAKGMAELIVAKNRNGKTGTINLACNLEYFEFKDK